MRAKVQGQRAKLLLTFLILALLAASCSSSEPATTTPDADASTDQEVSDSEQSPPDDTAVANNEDESEETSDAASIAEETPADVEPISFESADCEFLVVDGFEAECGWVEVPQQWDDAADPDTIRLHVATFTNGQTPADATPVVYLEGGPGGDTFFGLEFSLADSWGELINDHPFIAFTQRGSSLSEVDLECEEIVDLSAEQFERAPDLEADSEAALEALAACASRLIDEGADLTAYNTVASANDVEAVRQALGIESWNVFGISYGTRLGQELARTHPDAIESLVLDSVQPTDPALGSLASVPTTFQGSLERFFAGCEADTACAETYPDLETLFFDVIEQADATPFEVEGLDPLTGEPFEAVVDDSRLSSLVFNALYNPTAFAALPALFEELEAGETTILGTFLGIQVVNSEALSTGHFTAVICHDYTAELTDPSLYDDGLTGDPFFDVLFAGENAAETAQETCDVFPSGSADASVTEPVESDVPTLILSGAYDPITPPSFGEAVAPGFSNGQSVVLPNQGHAVAGSECGLEIALAFIAAPTSPVDQSCIETSPTPPFVAPSLEGTTFVPFEEALLGVSGVSPEGWSDQGFGTFVRGDANLADQLVLLQQAIPAPAAQFIGLFEAQLETVFVEAGEQTVGDRTWSIFEGESSFGDARVWTFEDGGSTVAAGLIGNSASFDDATEHLMPEILGNLSN